jgi:hypothetical protein
LREFSPIKFAFIREIRVKNLFPAYRRRCILPEKSNAPIVFAMRYKTESVAAPPVESAILLIRGQRVLLDRDLAAMYGVTTSNLNKAVRRNIGRFPADFMFQLTAEEAEALRFQIGILKKGHHFKHLPYVFTQEGVAMLSGVLRSPRAE